MASKNEFISNISQILGREMPKKVKSVEYKHSVHTEVMENYNQDQIAKYFKEYSESIGVKVFETNKKDLKDTILQAVKFYTQNGKVVVSAEDYFKDCIGDIKKNYDDVYVWKDSNDREENIKQAEAAEVSISLADLALAESGTVLLFSKDKKGRSVTLLPQSTIYIVPKSKIKPRLTQGMEYIRTISGELPTSLNYVSGPSATSDIELVRVVGVHGAVNACYILVKDE